MNIADRFSQALGKATKDLHKEKKQRERNGRARRRPAEHQVHWSLQDLCFHVMREAIDLASSGGTLPFPTRNLYYAIRPLVQQYTFRELTGTYFGQTIVVNWEFEHGKIPGHYRDPRGHFTEPHSDKVVPLGTREVDAYRFPSYAFDKILYIEKEGFQPIFEKTQLGERYDMAIASGKGQPVEAVRELLQRAEDRSYTLFVLHDADEAGYTIARALSEATDRMPLHRVDVIDLGLTVADAIERDLPTERYIRKKSVSWRLADRFTEDEKAWFVGEHRYGNHHECTRVELNALGSEGLVAFIEEKLELHGATAKVMPPEEVLDETVDEKHGKTVERVAREILDKVLDVDGLFGKVVELTRDDCDVTCEEVGEALEPNPPAPWREIVGGLIDDRIDHDTVKGAITEHIAKLNLGRGSE